MANERMERIRNFCIIAHWYNRALKRVFDLVLSLLGLIVVLPVTLVIAVLIRMDGPGPIFFAHRRIGQGGREFPCYKFRSMVPDAENVLKDYLAAHPEAREEWERDFKLKDDPRITHIGAFLRKTSLGGLPQAAATLTELRFHSPGLRAKTATLGKHPHKNLLLCKSGQGCAPSTMD